MNLSSPSNIPEDIKSQLDSLLNSSEEGQLKKAFNLLDDLSEGHQDTIKKHPYFILCRELLNYEMDEVRPEDIIRLKSKKVNISFMGQALKKAILIPPEIKWLAPNIEELDLRFCGVKKLPDEIGELKRLASLNLAANQLKELPENMAKLKKIEYLSLANNPLTSLPKALWKLKNLKYLDLAYLDLVKFAVRGRKILSKLQKFPKIEGLNLEGNALQEIPKEIGELKQLKRLELSANKLTDLPGNIEELKGLTYLSLNDNQLTTLPMEIIKLGKLETLHLAGNKLANLPEGISELQNLQVLNLKNNQLTYLPKSIIKLTNLKTLFLEKNSIKVTQEQKNWLFDLYQKDELTTLTIEQIPVISNEQHQVLCNQNNSRQPLFSFEKLAGNENSKSKNHE